VVGIREIKYLGWTKTSTAAGSLIYQGLEEENLDQKSPDPPGWGLIQRASSSLIVKKQEILKNQTPSLRNHCHCYDRFSHTKEFYSFLIKALRLNGIVKCVALLLQMQ